MKIHVDLFILEGNATSILSNMLIVSMFATYLIKYCFVFTIQNVFFLLFYTFWEVFIVKKTANPPAAHEPNDTIKGDKMKQIQDDKLPGIFRTCSALKLEIDEVVQIAAFS